jgi:hypothetical protein
MVQDTGLRVIPYSLHMRVAGLSSYASTNVPKTVQHTEGQNKVSILMCYVFKNHLSVTVLLYPKSK